MTAAEVVVREVQDSRLEIVEFLAECVGQSGEPTHLHSHGQVLPFDV